jgi:hypothetical protein
MNGSRTAHRCGKGMVALALFLLLAPALGCRRERATLALCQEILDRIVQLEMREAGFRDPALVQRKREELRKVLGPELKECEGKPIKSDALACVRTAPSAEEISHRCLR